MGDALLRVLVRKEVLSETEAIQFRSVLRLAAAPRSKYYTWEDYRKLMALAEKDWKDYTWEDVRELGRIADRMEREAMATDDDEYARELIRSAVNVRVFATVLEVLLARGESQ